MKIEKRSGGYRIQKMVNGKRYSFTFDHKPTKADIECAIADSRNRNELDSGINMTFEQAANRYVTSKSNVLSPSTYKDYVSMTNRFPSWFNDLNINDINQDYLNRFVNEISLNKSPKTVRNYHGFIVSVLNVYCPSFKANTHLPMKNPKESYIPTDEDIKLILDDVKGRPYELAIYMICYGLRRSELLAINPATDIIGQKVLINKSLVQNTDKQWVIKDYGKTDESRREIFIPQWLADRILEQGYIFNGHPNNITKYLYSAEDRLGLERFSMHKFRHYFASKMHDIGITDADIMALGGWKSDHIMKSVYRHSLLREEQKKTAAMKLQNELFSE